MQSFQSSTWGDIDELREKIMQANAASLEEAAQRFAESLAACPTTILARVFVVLPLARLHADEQRFASTLVGDPALDPRTPVLTLLGTAGRDPRWRDRTKSSGHRAIPLLGAAFVGNIPMLAKLLADLDVNLAGLEDGKVLDTRRLLGGKNAAFFVPDARTSRDTEGRQVIPSAEFVTTAGVRTVFGMGGAYLDGTLVVIVVFTAEEIDRLAVDRFPSLVGNFKIATGELLRLGHVYR